MQRVIVVGGGIAGSAAAMELAVRGVDVTLLEAEQPGVRATGASGGMLAPQYEASEGGARFELAVAARVAYPEFVARAESLADWEFGYRKDGMLVANRTSSEEEAAKGSLEWQHAAGLRGTILTPAEAVAEHPGLSPDMRSWLWLPDEAQVDAQRLAVGLGAAVQGAGAHLRLGHHVVAVESRGQQVTGVRLSSGEAIRADIVVVAAGAWSGTIEGIPREVPVRPVRGQILRLRPAEIPGWPLVATHDARYLVPRANGTVLLGSTMEDAGFDESVNEALHTGLAEQAAALVPSLGEAPVVERWAGLRPVTPDGWPVVGPEPRLDGLYYATGHGRNGILLGPITAKIIADLILEGSSTLQWEALGPDRFTEE